MKKTYNSPAIRIVKLNTARHILLTSGPQVTTTSANQKYDMDARSDNAWDIWGSENE